MEGWTRGHRPGVPWYRGVYVTECPRTPPPRSLHRGRDEEGAGVELVSAARVSFPVRRDRCVPVLRVCSRYTVDGERGRLWSGAGSPSKGTPRPLGVVHGATYRRRRSSRRSTRHTHPSGRLPTPGYDSGSVPGGPGATGGGTEGGAPPTSTSRHHLHPHLLPGSGMVRRPHPHPRP